ncbi:MAG: D-alanyl-D-alanine endopeptidase [Gammaproteobacteria bacterium]|nr:D-alanyl-D-alanine endopeptidase [Gammaproteobacteria bacterium]
MKISSLFGIVLCAVLVTAPAEGQIRLDPAGLELASAQAAVADLASGEILFTKHADRQVPIASVTKLMSAVVVLDSGERLDEWLTIVPRAERAPVNAYSRIRIGSELRRADLLRITLMASENQAAYVLSRHHPGGREAFVAAMNAKAAELGMHNSRFVDSSGLSAQNRSTAADLLRLLAAAMDYEIIRDYTRTTGFTAEFRNPRYTLQYGNTNLLVHRETWDVALSKTGYLQVAGRCLAMVANIDGRPIAMVLLDSLGTRTPLGDAGRIGRWLRTGQGGSVAVAARDYERQRQLEYARQSSVPGVSQCDAANGMSDLDC